MFSLRSNALPPLLSVGEGRPSREARMARPKIAAEKLRTATIGVRVSPGEYAALREKAAALGLTPAQWLRTAALARRLPAPAAGPVNVATYRELGRIGTNLNQLAARLNAGAAGEPPAARLQTALAELAEQLRRVRLEVLGVKEAGA